MSQANLFVGLKPGAELPLRASDRFAAAGHLWSQPEIDALILASAARRPLLVRGEAGSGKSQIARAAAWVLGEAQPLVEVIHARFEALDLLYRIDALERLADAQLQQLDTTNVKYVKHGRLWEAMDRIGEGKATPVLLIDEMDKADADVPNALLEVLGNRSFAVPLIGCTVHAAGGRMPLIIITTNEERELPAAFVRRCAVLNVSPPVHESAEGKADFRDWLVTRGRVHRHLDIAAEARTLAARQVLADREAAQNAGYSTVGLAEYIDLLTALHELTRDVPVKERAAGQISWLHRLGAYALVKNPGQRQDRTPLSPTSGADPSEDESA